MKRRGLMLVFGITITVIAGTTVLVLGSHIVSEDKEIAADRASILARLVVESAAAYVQRHGESTPSQAEALPAELPTADLLTGGATGSVTLEPAEDGATVLIRAHVRYGRAVNVLEQRVRLAHSLHATLTTNQSESSLSK